MSDFTTIFEITANSNGLRDDAWSGVAALAFVMAVGVSSLVLVWRQQRRIASMVAPVVFFIVMGTIVLMVNEPRWRIGITETRRLVDLQRSQAIEVTEGVVHVKRMQPAHGHSSGDKITVGGREFEINYFLATPGYRQTIAHGGALREGVYARLHHEGGVILKVEVKQPSPPQEAPPNASSSSR